MDMYGVSTTTTTQDLFRIDDLLDFSNEEIFSASSSSTTAATHSNTTTTTTDTNHLLPSQNLSIHSFNPSLSTDFTDDLCVPSDDVAELEWLSRFVDDSFTDFPKNSITGTLTVRSDTSLSGRGRGKRSKATNSTTSNTTTWTWTSETGNSKPKRESHRQSSPTPDGGVRRCTHCQSEKTPQWRTGPLGPKTLCNACGVRYKSGRLVPEYRPAASPTFVLTQHSNSHRKVLELRRQKEMLRQQQQQQGQSPSQMYRHQRDFEVC
ncbi:hypothetical protein Patl1_00171 [Pistacia atlantica]|uniref:Uncharacterized protein n=1 Tax=Pistacia atlantica TaxID=434234 RepID=A0ACC1C8U1_9ROSI|nr:hypothetical protein Patl1_00171 [Pistacia atlantica]